jgi:hypothetical protein
MNSKKAGQIWRDDESRTVGLPAVSYEISQYTGNIYLGWCTRREMQRIKAESKLACR